MSPLEPQNQNHFTISSPFISSMASLPFSPLILGISISLFISLFFSPVHSITCAKQKLPENRTYANCTELPSLGATLHYTYNATNRSLSIAFAAEPSTHHGWVAWGINPAGGGMVGAGALIAYKLGGKVTVNTYNLTSYKSIEQTKLSFDVWDLVAIDNSGEITIFALVKLPEKADNLSQIWQVGPVTNGKPDKHDFAAANLNAKAALQLVGTTASAPSESGSGGSGNNTAKGDKNDGVRMMGQKFGLGFYLGLVLVLMSM